MTRVCTVCRHEERVLVEDELARGVPLRTISTTYRLSYSALRRHSADHMIIADGEDGAREVMRLQDVIDIPLQMKERAQLINALLQRALEPLMGRGKGFGIDETQLGFIVNLLRLQQTDEQTVLKMTGMMRGSIDTSNIMDTDAYNKLRSTIDAALGQYQEERPLLAEPPEPPMPIIEVSQFHGQPAIADEYTNHAPEEQADSGDGV